jgi:crotonobetainyl-CoA:carnitine CoA-transferase CaiB-like acyl-CoA transferase
MKAPLEGILVLDLTRNLAGPFCTMILGDLGARVIKVERPGAGDDTRHWHPPSWNCVSSVYLATNRNKESITVDIETPGGREIILRLAEKADILVESFRGGSLDRKGLGFNEISKINPKIVYCSLSAFGAKGPAQNRPGYDALIQAYSGIMSITGEPGRDAVRVGPSIIDQGSAHWAAIGILSALRLRDQTGEAQRVETSLLETGFNWMSYFAAGYFADGTVPGRSGARHGVMAPYEDFRTLDGVLYIAAPNQNLFSALCEVLGVGKLVDDPRFANNTQRLQHRNELHDALEEKLASATSAAWEEKLLAAGVPCSRLQSVDQVVKDPQVKALGLVRDFSHKDIANHQLVDHPVSYNGRRAFRTQGAPALGEHTDSVLRDLGYDDAAIDELASDGAFGPKRSAEHDV